MNLFSFSGGNSVVTTAVAVETRLVQSCLSIMLLGSFDIDIFFEISTNKCGIMERFVSAKTFLFYSVTICFRNAGPRRSRKNKNKHVKCFNGQGLFF